VGPQQLRLLRANECTHEPPVYLRYDRIDVDAFASEELPRIFHM
jgi:hypothetical protein